MIPKIVYILCALTSIACAGMLVRGYVQTRVKLLLWSSLCFVGLALNNILLVADRVFYPAVDLFLLRSVPGAVGLLVLLISLIWETE